jgi:acetoin utilization deacetylase AcuC-like enzyme
MTSTDDPCHKVLVVSLHHAAAGFFPGSGRPRDLGRGRGAFHTLNLPFKAGLSDKHFLHVFTEVIINPSPLSTWNFFFFSFFFAL